MQISKNIKKLIQILLFFAGMIILFFIITRSGIIENYRILFTVSVPLLILAFILSNINIIIKIYRWKYLSEKYNQPVTMRDASIVTISSLYFANITPGKVGDLFKAFYICLLYTSPSPRDG